MTTQELLPLEIPRLLWFNLIRALRARGEGRRESGAFLLSRPKNRRVRAFVPYDDLDPHALDKGYIHFADSGFVPLWKLCAARGLSVIADVHTHPGQWTDLSGSDREHPMIAQGGHIALIVPSYAAMNSLGTNGVGAHLYLGSGEWESMEPSNLIHLKWL
jgi:proteasome lid subunit RPN8/RPN11